MFLRKKSLTNEIQQKVSSYEKNCKWKTGLIDQANGSKVEYLSANPKADFDLYVEYYVM